MLPEPLHPAVVHFPLVFAVLLPLVAVAGLVMLGRGSDVWRAWVPVIALAVALPATTWLAVETGEHDEEVVEEIVPEAVIHDHEEAGELLLVLALSILVLSCAGLAPGRAGRIMRYVTAVSSILLIGAGYRAGHTGGELVYTHGAASAFADPAGSLEAYGVDAEEENEEGEERNRRR